MEQGGVEEDGVTLGERQLHVVGHEVLLELGQPVGEVAVRVLLRVRQVERRAGLDGHVAVRDGALQGEHRRQGVHVGRELGRGLGALEAEVVVAVHRLAGAAGVHDVDLAVHLVAGAEPRPGRQGDDVVGVVLDERLGVEHRELLERVPHPVVGARGPEVVAGRAAGRLLLRDDLLERGRSPGRRRPCSNAPRKTVMPGPSASARAISACTASRESSSVIASRSASAS